VLTHIDCFVLSDYPHEENDDVNSKPIPCKRRRRIVTNSDKDDTTASLSLLVIIFCLSVAVGGRSSFFSEVHLHFITRT